MGGDGDSRKFDLSYLFLAMAVLGEVVATSALKASAQFTRPMPAWVVVVGYATAFYCLSLSLNQLPLGIAYAICAGVGTSLIALLGCVLIRQALNPGAVIGILRIGVLPGASGAPSAQDGHVAGIFSVRQHPHWALRWWAIFALAATRPV
jgi:small multidrug resistance pump